MDQSKEKKLLLAYWKGRGRAQPIRFLLEYLALPYEEKLYTIDDEGKEWFEKDKLNFPGPFPNLPYIKDGERYLTETEAILRFVCKKGNRKDLLGKSDDDADDICMIRGVINDNFVAIEKLVYDENFEKIRDETLKTKIEPKLELLSKYLGEKEFIYGYITYLDFLLFETTEILSKIKSETIEKFPNLNAFHKRFNEQKYMKDYKESERAVTKPFCVLSYWNEEAN